MCSLSWHHHQDGYEVFFNRDEKKTRGRALPPTLEETQGVRFIAPRDADAGGTWLLANEWGVTLALLNYWHSNSHQRPSQFSRGQLLKRDLAHYARAADAMAHLQTMSLTAYGSFTLAAFDLSLTEGPMVMRWNGDVLAAVPAEMPLCSSSYLPEWVVEMRQRSFHALPDATPATLWQWHSHELTPTAFSVRMNRPDAQTWSISHLSVSQAEIHWRYVEEMPELSTPACVHEVRMKKG